jgi:hypothetical protein
MTVVCFKGLREYIDSRVQMTGNQIDDRSRIN